MLEDLDPRGSDWHLLLGTTDRLQRAVRSLHQAGPVSNLIDQADEDWRLRLTSPSWRYELNRTCERNSRHREFAGADAQYLYTNACSHFAAGVAFFCLLHLDEPAIASRLPDWLGRAADPEHPHSLLVEGNSLLLPAASKRPESRETANEARDEGNQHLRERLRWLADALARLRGQPDQPDFCPVQLLLRLKYWLDRPRLPDNSIQPLFHVDHVVRVPCVSWNQYVQTDAGQIHDLCLQLLRTGPRCLIQAPNLWNRPFARDWLETLEQAFGRCDCAGPVVWSYETQKLSKGGKPRQVFTSTGQSHMAAAQVGFRVLASKEKLHYDGGCLIAATVKEDGTTLDGVLELKNKCDTAQDFGLDRVVIAADPEPKFAEEVDAASYGKGTPPLLVVPCKNLDQALDEATGLTHGLRRYLNHLLGLPDQKLPPYLYGRKLTDLDGSKGLFIDLWVIRREDGSPGARLPRLSRSGASVGSEVSGALDPEEHTKGRTEWEREWHKLFRAILVGPVGGGKSVVARMTVHKLARQGLAELQACEKRATDITLPIWLPLLELAKHGSLEEAVRATLPKPEGKELGERLTEHLKKSIESLARPNCWLVLDGYDEAVVRDREPVSRELARLNNGKCRVLLTSRPWATIPEQPPLTRADLFELVPLDFEQQKAFLRAWYGDGKNPARRQMLEAMIQDSAPEDVFHNPLHLTLACAEGELRGLQHNVSRAQLFYWIVGDLIGGAWQEELPSPSSDQPVDGVSPARSRLDEHHPWHGFARLALQQFAWDRFQSDPARVEFAEVTWFHSMSAQGEPKSKAEELLNVCRKRGLLVPHDVRDGDILRYGWAFAHRSFLDFLAAEQIAIMATFAFSRSRDWCAKIIEVLGRSPEHGLEMVKFLGGCLRDDLLRALTEELILAVPAEWHSWADVLQKFLAGTQTKSPVLDTLRAAVKSPALHLHPEALLTQCHAALSSRPEPDCQAMARDLEQAARERCRFWCLPDRSKDDASTWRERDGQRRSARLHYFVGVRQLCGEGSDVFSLSQNGTLAKWTPDSGASLYINAGQTRVNAFAVLAGGRRLLAGCEDGAVRICYAAPSRPEPKILYREKSPVTALLAWPRERIAVIGHGDGLLVLLSLNEPTTPLELGWHRGAIRHLIELTEGPAVEGDGRPSTRAGIRVASGGDDGVVRWWSLREKVVEQSRSFSERYGAISRLAWCPVKRRIVSGHVTGVVASWPVEAGEAESPRMLLRDVWPISTLALTGPGGVLVGDMGGHVYRLSCSGPEVQRRLIHQHAAPVAGVAVRGDQVHSVDELGNRKTERLNAPSAAITDTERLRWLKDARLVCGDRTGEVEVFEPDDHQRLDSTQRPDQAIVAIAVPPSGGVELVAVGRDGTLRFGAGTGCRFRCYKEPITSLVAAGRYVVAGTTGGKLLVFDACGSSEQVLSASRAKVTALAWWEAERSVVCGDALGRVRLLRIAEDGTMDWRVPLPVAASAPVLCLEAVDGLGVVASCADETVACLRPVSQEFERVSPSRGSAGSPGSRVLCLTAWEEGRAVAGRADGTLGYIAAGPDGPYFRTFGDVGKDSPTRSLARWTLPTGQTILVSGHRDGWLRCWTSLERDPTAKDGADQGWSALDRAPQVLSTPHRGPVTSLVASGSVLASSAAGGVVSLRHWSTPQGATKYVVQDAVTALAWLRSGRLAVGLSGGDLVVLAVRGLRPGEELSRP